MNPFHRFAAAVFAVLSFFSFNAFADPDPAASVVLLRTSCNDGADGTLNNCFTDMDSVTSWIENTRKPNATTPLAVEIGPGAFSSITLECSSTFTGFTTFRGAGQSNTTIGTFSEMTAYSVHLGDCTSMVFKDMTIGPTSAALGGIDWRGTGTSIWENIVMITGGYGWNDQTANCPTSGNRGAHYWLSSRLVSTGLSSSGVTRTYESRCAEDWFIGSEVTVNKTQGGGQAYALHAIGSRSEIHFYGGVLRVLLSGTTPTQNIAAASAVDGGQIHIHGTGIDVLTTLAKSISALRTSGDGSMIHANASAYNLRTGSGGSVTRINNTDGKGHIHAPYLWEHIPDTDGNPSTVDTNFTSANGADQTTVTVGTSDGHPHTAVYSSTCPSNLRWYDQVDKICRGQ